LDNKENDCAIVEKNNHNIKNNNLNLKSVNNPTSINFEEKINYDSQKNN
jgi:hypothetical protein